MVFKEQDTDREKVLKYQIAKKLPNRILWKTQRRISSIFKFEGLRSKINEYKTYEKTWHWRKKILNLYNLSKLINIIILLVAVVLLFNPMLLNLNSGTFYLLIVFLILMGITITNLIFVLLPMRIPGLFNDLGIIDETKEGVQYIKKTKVPPTPVLPPSKDGDKVKPKLKAHQIDIQLPGLKKPTIPSKSTKSQKESIDEYGDLGVPEVPVAPPKQKLKLETIDISPELLKKIEEGETKDLKYIIVKCDECDDIIAVPIPKKKILESELPVVPITFVHGEGNKEHALTVHIDHDFDVRRRRFSDVVYDK